MTDCVQCGGKTMVIDSRPTSVAGGALRRRRKCSCGYRFTTIELTMGVHPRAMEIALWAAEEMRCSFDKETDGAGEDGPREDIRSMPVAGGSQPAADMGQGLSH